MLTGKLASMWRTLTGLAVQQADFDQEMEKEKRKGRLIQRQIDVKVRKLEQVTKELEAAAQLAHDLQEDFRR